MRALRRGKYVAAAGRGLILTSLHAGGRGTTGAGRGGGALALRGGVVGVHGRVLARRLVVTFLLHVRTIAVRQ